MEKMENHEELSIRRIDNSQLPAYFIDNLQCNQRIINAIDFLLSLARQDEVDKFRYLIIVLILIGDHA